MAKSFKQGDRVEWNSHGSKAVGTVKRKITEETEAGGRKVKASEDEPQYLVEQRGVGRHRGAQARGAAAPVGLGAELGAQRRELGAQGGDLLLERGQAPREAVVGRRRRAAAGAAAGGATGAAGRAGAATGEAARATERPPRRPASSPRRCA